MNRSALNSIGPYEGEAESEAGQYWMVEYEGLVYMVPIWDDLILYHPKVVGHA